MKTDIEGACFLRFLPAFRPLDDYLGTIWQLTTNLSFRDVHSCAEWSGVDQMDAPAIIGLMLQSQYYDVLRDIGSHGAKTVFVPSSPANVTDVSTQIRDALLHANATK
jgi:hypothetical protein